MSKKYVATPDSLKQDLSDIFVDMEELIDHAVRFSTSLSKLINKMSGESFIIQEAVRKQLTETRNKINGILESGDNTIWDNSIAKMPDGVENFIAEEWINKKRDEIILSTKVL